MASSSGVQQQQQQQQHFQQSSSAHHCKECGIFLNSAESLEVHLHYHKENLLNKWATQAAASSHSEETNNNNTKPNMKREFIPNTIAAAADSSDAMVKKSPEYGSRATPETSVNFGHPPTPQSYQSASSPYQNNTPNDTSTFSPGFQNYQSIKQERSSPNFHQNYNYPENQFFNMESSQQPNYDYIHKIPTQNPSFRYHPYQQPQQQQYEQRPQSQTQVSSSSPAYPPQPTPSPSPKQCDKCGYVCESATQLVEHLNIAHPPTPAPHLATYQQNQHFLFGNQQDQTIKTEEDQQSEILDLDSHKVHQIYSEEEKRQNGETAGHNPHSVSAMLSPWTQQKMYPQDQRIYVNGREQKLFTNGMISDNFSQQEQQKLFQPHQEYLSASGSSAGVTTSSQEVQNYRPFEHLPPQPTTPVISSTQLPNPAPTNGPPTTKSANWKSNEARRPKTYNCTACNKWFTSSGHLKRHYNTTLHKNAVKSSGQPDPATLPISAHHHPARDSSSNREDTHSGSPNDDSRGDDNSMSSQFDRSPGILQQSYERQAPPANIHHAPLGATSITNLTNGSPPNGEAGPSASNIDSRGLLSLTNTPQHHGFNMAPTMVMENSHQFPMYPNVSAPHVTQPTATSSHNTTGEYQHHHHHQYIDATMPESQPLPSFEQFQAHRYGIVLSYGGTANVGGGGPVTAPYSYYSEPTETSEPTALIFRQEEEDYKIILSNVDQAACAEEEIITYSPSNHNNNNNNNNNDLYTECDVKVIKSEVVEEKKQQKSPPSPEKAKTKRDYEETTGSPQISSTVQAKQQGIHKCFDCDKIFNKACYLTQHNKTFHSGDKPFKCQRCGKRFSSDMVYQDHVTKHAGEKPYKCDLCPKQFNHKTDLRRHMCLHTGQKPYACDTCGKGFIRKDHMLKHCETHTRKPHVANKVSAVR